MSCPSVVGRSRRRVVVVTCMHPFVSQADMLSFFPRLLVLVVSRLSWHDLITRLTVVPPAPPPSLHHPSTNPNQSGVRQYQSLPRQTFGQLQSRLTPLYFSTSTLLTSTLFITHLYFHPSLISSPLSKPHWWSSEEGRQGLLIVAGLIPNLVNWLIVGPKATDVMFERHRVERIEGKEYDSPDVSFGTDFTLFPLSLKSPRSRSEYIWLCMCNGSIIPYRDTESVWENHSSVNSNTDPNTINTDLRQPLIP